MNVQTTGISALDRAAITRLVSRLPVICDSVKHPVSRFQRRDAADPEVQSSEPMCAAPWRPVMADL